jgi:ankyrin repeat protein
LVVETVPQAVPQTVIEECVGNAHGNLARVEELITQYPAAVNARAPWNETPIEAATQMGNKPIIDLLLRHGAPLDFFTACVLGRTDQVRTELAANPDQAEARGVHDLPTLYFAAIGGQRDVADLLLASGAGVNEHCQAAAPLHGALMGGHPDMVRWLLEHGADPTLPDYKGRGARQLAEDMQRSDLAALFD